MTAEQFVSFGQDTLGYLSDALAPAPTTMSAKFYGKTIVGLESTTVTSSTKSRKITGNKRTSKSLLVVLRSNFELRNPKPKTTACVCGPKARLLFNILKLKLERRLKQQLNRVTSQDSESESSDDDSSSNG